MGRACTVFNQRQSGDIGIDFCRCDRDRGRCGFALTYFSQLDSGQVVSPGGELVQHAGDVECGVLKGKAAHIDIAHRVGFSSRKVGGCDVGHGNAVHQIRQKIFKGLGQTSDAGNIDFSVIRLNGSKFVPASSKLTTLPIAHRPVSVERRWWSADRHYLPKLIKFESAGTTLGYISPMRFETNWFAAQLKKAA
ncbi:unannotated protein [freshwater metagenome]|uniref:Unannotated protein n=1 Tax=freshwater metagenome TaxID=449393 RepID=A0A6J6Q434_9ZZZZ